MIVVNLLKDLEWCSLLGGFCFLSSLDSLAVVSLVDSLVSELLVSLGALHFSGDSLDLASLGD